MKHLIIILACMVGSVTAQAQPVQYRENEKGIKKDFSPMRHPSTAFQKSAQNDMQFPLEGLYYWGETSGYPYDTATGTITYKYHEDGKLREVFYDVFPRFSTLMAEKHECNNTFVMEGKDMWDTITLYSISDGVYTPRKRYCYNYHYYDKFETDSFFYEQFRQVWDPVNKKWKNTERYYWGYADTVLWNNTRAIVSTGTESGWEPISIYCDSLVYDEHSYVTARFATERYISSPYGDTTKRIKYDYSLNEDGSIYAIDAFLYLNGAWNLLQKRTDITWALWLGYGGFDVLPIAGVGEWIPINGKRNKKSSETVWVKNDDDEWEFNNIKKIYWNLDDYDSNIDTVFVSLDEGETLYRYCSTTYRYDEYGNDIEYAFFKWGAPDAEGNQRLTYGDRDKSEHLYNDWGWYKSEYWSERYDTTTQQWDSLTEYKEEVIKWGDPFNSIAELPSSENQLTIVPNPACGVITISAVGEIEQLQIFDIVGRMVHSQSPAGKEVVFDTGILPKGIYLMRAQLKDGGTMTGKVMVK